MAYNIQPPVRREKKSMFELPKEQDETFSKDSFKEEDLNKGEFADESGLENDSIENDDLGRSEMS